MIFDSPLSNFIRVLIIWLSRASCEIHTSSFQIRVKECSASDMERFYVEIMTNSRIHCLVKCGSENGCSTAKYEGTSGICSLFNSTSVCSNMINHTLENHYTKIWQSSSPSTTQSTEVNQPPSTIEVVESPVTVMEATMEITTVDTTNEGCYKHVQPDPSQPSFQVRCSCSIPSRLTILRNYGEQTAFWDKNFRDFQLGFGHVTGDHMLGLDKIHLLTAFRSYDLTLSFAKDSRFVYKVKYSNIRVANGSDQYRINFSWAKMYFENEYYYVFNDTKFSAKDNDADGNDGRNCAALYKHGFWYNHDCNNCLYDCFLRDSIVGGYLYPNDNWYLESRW